MLVQHTCPGCGATGAQSTFEPLACTCSFCRHGFTVTLPTDGSVRTPVLGLRGLAVTGRWNEALLRRAAGGDVVVDRCPQCESPVTAAAAAPVARRCPHCGALESVALGDHVVDALPTIAVQAQTWGGGMRLTWQPEHLQGGSDESLPCPHCGAAVPPFSGATRCAHCATALFGLLSCGRRFVPGMRMRGDDEGRPVDRWLPMPDALDQWGKRRELVSESRKTTASFMLAWIFGLAAFPVVGFLLILVIAIAAPRVGPAGLLGLVLLAALLPLALFGGLVFWAIRRAKRKRDELLG